MTRRVYLLLTILMAFFSTHCGDCTRVEKSPYRGDPNATQPYHVVSMMQPTLMGACNYGSCSYAVVAVVDVHNPLQTAITFDTTCEYYVDDYHAETSQRLNETLDARTSARVELQEQVQAEPNVSERISVSCDVIYR